MRSSLLVGLFGLIYLTAVSLAASAYGSRHLSAYIVDWNIPKSIPWTKLDHVIYSFAIPNKDGKLGDFDANQLKKVVKDAHAHKKGVSLSIGGWSGSLYFSSLVRTSASREKFANNLVQAVKTYNVNGLDLDWEYPNNPDGVSCNEKNANDTPNYLKLIQLLRKKLDAAFPNEHKTISAAVSTTVFRDGNQNPYKKLASGWKNALDYVNIMAYDLAGPWNPKTSSNSPLYSKNGEESIDSSVKQWVAAGIPKNRIVVGVPFYGYTALTTSPATAKSGIKVAYKKGTQIKGDQYDSKGADPCKGAKSSYSGDVLWKTIASKGIVRSASGWKTVWDSTSQTYFSYAAKTKQFLTFDDPRSLRAKATYVQKNKLAGVMLWSLDMDDSKNSLLNSLQAVRS
ncbi:glycoside hydrolase family 18 protein [Phycomyces blakesleeanus]|uniref:Glycoside hydrolase family 18 protein n=2 Tax=Phycomyces blakesleeanus TaxID=4837 RepID=A0A163CWK8_PHYB8|nr:glycoside hydrolase family 18 protein [Phycomyces blakesleeanus NRRL 1555(-)]OAD66130.1 glycoside hydrolase family 18 protein [Phycomyces blakesleeanus NRRL 1555(-)]|eukprot:XP_018284170.1 glycoside hydrolase family 18 protein [Phycomyces blakesleeanus NRRL 1555(-)]